MLTSSLQMTVWEHVEALTVRLHEELNGLGPYKLPSTDDVHRHCDCSNYDGCLTFAAANKWASFSCKNCRKAAHGEFVLEETNGRPRKTKSAYATCDSLSIND